MSDRPLAPSDRASVEISEETLGEHLARRASRPAPRGLATSIIAQVDETIPERRWRLAVAAWRPRMAVAVSGLVVVVVAGLLFINAMPAHVGTDRGSPAPTAGAPSPAGPPGVVWDPTVRALTPPQLLQILAARPPAGTTLIVDDQIEPSGVSCATAEHCPTGQLVNAGGTFVESPTGGELPFAPDGGRLVIGGPVALTVGSSPNLVYLGSIVSNGLRLAFTVGDLQARNATGGLFVIPGWLSAAPVRPCPPASSGCTQPDWLTETETPEPDRAEVRFAVQPGASLSFGSSPTGQSEGTYLVRDVDGHGDIVARLESLAIPSVDTSGPGNGTVWNATERPLAPAELAKIIAKQPPVGTVLIVDDQIVELVLPCTKEQACPAGKLVDTGLPVRAPVGGHLPFGAASEIPGPLALQVTEGSWLVFLGTVARNGSQMAFTANDLIVGGARDNLYVVPAWLWKAEPMPCPTGRTTPPPSPTSELGLPAPEHNICAGANYLTDDAPTLPLTVDQSDRFLVQNGAYGTLAPFPNGSGSARLAVYLVRDWSGYGEVVARLEPIQVPVGVSVGPSPTTEPNTPVSPTSHVMAADAFVGRVLDGSLPGGSVVVADIPAAAVTVLSPTGAGEPENPNQSRWAISAAAGYIRVDGIAKDGIAGIAGVQAFLVEPSRAVRALGPVAMDGRAPAGLFIAHGWLRNGPPSRCHVPTKSPTTGLLGKPLTWSLCPGTWILPTADDPWPTAADYTKSDSSMPPGTLHVQDNALGTYIEASEGFWLVRLVASNPCPPGYFCSLVLPDKPMPGVSWYELVGPIVAPAPDSVEQRPPPAAP